MSIPSQVIELVERFERNLEAYKSGQYNETQVRREFIDPFFMALGWDVDNRQGYAEAYKDVVHEDSIKIDLSTKAPDYCFRVGGARKFFLEAKKPSVDIKGDIHPAYQLRRYAWSARLPLSILTDFEEFAVYDCRVKPAHTDSAATARVLYITFREYAERWDELYALYSREAVLKGSFDRYADSTDRKKGTAGVDEAFLREIESWREALARNIALRNPSLSTRELNFAVQRTIDRVIFLRICEDRGIEPYGQLLQLPNGPRVYPRLVELFRRADARYNSGIFHFENEKDQSEEPDLLTPSLSVDDAPLKDIIKSLYYPESPYEFSVLPAEILGQVYEQFLGKVIRLTAGHRAQVEDKPEVKKAGGVFYTPSYIVDYIVEHTLGALLEGKTIDQARGTRGGAPLRVLDPACGSGSFLIVAYQRLLDWYRERYQEDEPEKHAKGKSPALYQSPGGWRLTTREKRRILLDHIYGVDIDPQAVEVTKLSLALKVLENESEQTLSSQLSLFRERALPDLGANIKCGNSLIGPDFYEDAQLSLLDDEERYRVNVFDWAREFPFIGAGGGFDAVIGNPPYIRIQALKEWAPKEVEFYKERYRSASKGNYDIYVVFVEKGLSLLSERGKLGFILPHKFFNAQYGEALRGIIAEGKHLEHVVHFGDQQVFKGATTYTCLMFLCKVAGDRIVVEKISDLNEWKNSKKCIQGIVTVDSIQEKEWNFTVGPGTSLIKKLASLHSSLGSIANIFVGLQTSADQVFLFKNFKKTTIQGIVEVYSKGIDSWLPLEAGILKQVVRSGEINRYSAKASSLVLYPYIVENNNARLMTPEKIQANYPKAWDYLELHKKTLQEREKGAFKDNHWYRFGRVQNLGIWEQAKLMIPYMITRLAAYYDANDDLYFINVTTGGFGVTINTNITLQYLCGLLNSKLLDYYLKQISTNFRDNYVAANKQFIKQLPIRTINFDDPADRDRHDRMVALVERMLSLHRELAAAREPHQRTALQRQIDATDAQIDALVYELYGLTDDEIAVVEGAGRN